MNTHRFLTSTCRCCNYYEPEGRRGGTCQQLGVPVKGCWKACSLATHPFVESSLKALEEELETNIVRLEESYRLPCPKSLSGIPQGKIFDLDRETLETEKVSQEKVAIEKTPTPSTWL